MKNILVVGAIAGVVQAILYTIVIKIDAFLARALLRMVRLGGVIKQLMKV